jgi:chromosome segregation ATPase
VRFALPFLESFVANPKAHGSSCLQIEQRTVKQLRERQNQISLLEASVAEMKGALEASKKKSAELSSQLNDAQDKLEWSKGKCGELQAELEAAKEAAAAEGCRADAAVAALECKPHEMQAAQEALQVCSV